MTDVVQSNSSESDSPPRRRRAEWIALGVVVVVAAVGVSAVVAHRNDAAKPPVTTLRVVDVHGVTTHLTLDATTVASGGKLHGTVSVDNATGVALHGSKCGEPFAAELHQSRFGQMTFFTTCDRPFTIPTGVSTYPVTVTATYSQCTPRAGDVSADYPKCTANGIPGLPVGHYRAVVVGQSDLVSSALPVDVVVK